MHNIWCPQSSIKMNLEIAGGETEQSEVEKYQACLNPTWTKTTNFSTISSCSQTLQNLTCLKLSQKKKFPSKTLHSTHLYLNCSHSIHHLLLRDVFLSTTTITSWWWLPHVHAACFLHKEVLRLQKWKKKKNTFPESCPQRGLQCYIKKKIYNLLNFFVNFFKNDESREKLINSFIYFILFLYLFLSLQL